MGFFADSIGATIGATAAFILGRTVSLALYWFYRFVFAWMNALSFDLGGKKKPFNHNTYLNSTVARKLILLVLEKLE